MASDCVELYPFDGAKKNWNPLLKNYQNLWDLHSCTSNINIPVRMFIALLLLRAKLVFTRIIKI